MTETDSFLPESRFRPMTGMKNRHIMTIAANYWPRRFPRVVDSQDCVLVQVDDHSSVLVEVNVAEGAAGQSSDIGSSGGRTGVILLHGLEGSSRSGYVLGLAHKLLEAGLSVFRMNMRNCGGTIHLTPSLYNGGLSSDLNTVAGHLVSTYSLDGIFLVGFSLGGNVVLKAAAELSEEQQPWLRGVCGISPSIELRTCVDAIEQGFNRIYELNFVRGLKKKIRQKARLYPGRFNLSRLSSVKGIRQFDELFTAPDGGYDSAEDYYSRASSLPMLDRVKVPALLITSRDDPIVPFSCFQSPLLRRPGVTLLATEHGGHTAFVSGGGDGSVGLTYRDRFWAEHQVVRFCLSAARDDVNRIDE